jgi:RNA polymerase sigma factor (sigma-70 family)
MTQSPETRASLIVRLRNRTDQEAWFEFVEIYRPVVYRLARAKGLQDADAEDLVQQVLTAVAGAIERWDPDPGRGRFRSWLGRIAHNQIVNALARAAPDRATGGSSERDALDQLATYDGPDSKLLRTEYRREVFAWAARQVRVQFQAETWDAFWYTAVEGREIAEVAGLLGKQPGAVYAARSRVMRRLKKKILEWDNLEATA